MPHWWTPCIEAYPIRMPERKPEKVKAVESTVEPVFPKALPLREVVAECERRWFEQTLKSAKSGDISSQCLVGQMFCSGYGVPPNVKKIRSTYRVLTYLRWLMESVGSGGSLSLPHDGAHLLIHSV